MIKQLAFLGALFLTGCVTTNGNQGAFSSGQDKPVSSIKNYQADTLAHFEGAFVQAVDGKNVSYASLFSGPCNKTAKLSTGRHEIVIINVFNPGFPSLWRTCTAELSVDLKSGVKYQLQMKAIGEHSESWLVDDQGNQASEIIKAPCKATVGQQIIM